ncbi:TonB-dependent receptor [Agrobacterium tumefaciens]|nr:TonB-dependent receptor [Agrobacterium tumefaciens]MCW8059215.1 TonB-dependent receptor [Agrobacterium tumefaciens]MCW8147211.1 TonB-dependent receptor [Agrobacterium tumefaciens]NTA49983.1 TonB-dependent receptor [Agrobacterium tumefaciens]
MSGVSALTLATLFVTPVLGQDQQATTVGTTVLKPIVVTGEKVARDMKNTASSVSVISGDKIKKEKTGDPTVSEAIKDIPNVVYTDNVSAPIIRGLDTQGPNTGATAFFAGTVPRATINVDGHYLGYNEFIYGATSIWDVESIEVFRGPQTTSQGANAIAGAIIVNTKDPTFTPEASYQAEIGNYHQKRASFALSGPLVEDQLAARLAVDYSGRDTFIDYINSAFAHEGTDQDFKEFNGRFKLLWEPPEIPGLTTKLTYSYNAANRPSQEAASRPFEDLNHVTTTMPSWSQNTHTGILDINYDFENGVKLFNQTQFSASDARRRVGVVNNGDADIDQTNTSHETRVTFGDQEDVLSGVAGIYYAHTQADELLRLTGRYNNSLSTFDDTKDNLGIFSELSYRLTDQWTLTGGLRYQQDRIQRTGRSVYSAQAVDFDETFSELLPKATLAYAVNDDWTVGGMISRGYNPGGVSLNISSGKWMTFEEEKIWNYELFTRASLLDDRLVLNSNLFYMDYTNAQFNIPVVISSGVTQSYTINAQKAHAYGLEVGADYQVLDNLTLKASAGLLKTEIDEIASNTSYAGNEFAKSPGYMFSIGASWDVTDKFTVSGQVRHIDGYYSDTANTATYAIDPYTIADVRASYKFQEELEFYAYVKNVFDERAPTYMQQNRGIGGIEASMTEPRMFGIGVRGTF